MDDLLGEFLTETAEGLAELDLELVRLEQNPNDPDLISSIFRIVHTIKGTCGFLDLPRLETLAHAAENVLGKFRDRELEVTPQAVTVILQTLDQIKALLASLEQTEKEPAGDDADLIGRLDALAAGKVPAGVADPSAAVAGSETGGDALSAEEVTGRFYDRLVMEPDFASILTGNVAEVEKRLFRNYMQEALRGKAPAFEFPIPDGLDQAQFDSFITLLDETVREMGVADGIIERVLHAAEEVREAEGGAAPAASAEPVAAASAPAPAAVQAAANDAEPAEREIAAASQNIRVGVNLLENLMTVVSELVLTRNQLLQMVRNQEDSEFSAPLQRLNHITSELQEGVMKTRMQPIGNAWSKLPRIVRDISHELGKKVELEMRGADTELDRQVLELIKDPLTHMVRNSLDHGLEDTVARRAAGKPETGKIRLNAFHQGGHIIIEIADDGRGLSIDKIRKKAIENGIVSAAEAETMSETLVQQLIFRAGFSTAEKVTNVSGRGVGMDVVRSNIEKIGGTIGMQTTAGRGTVFTIKIPLTLAIVSSLIVECAGNRFAIPQISVLELVRASQSSDYKIEGIDGAPFLRLRNRLLPLVSLRELLGFGKSEVDENGRRPDDFVVVSQVGAYTFGILVDRVFDTEEIVVKPVAPVLRDNGIFSGNTILGDGSVVMILDPNGIATKGGELAAAESQVGDYEERAEKDEAERIPLLLFRAGDNTPKVVPLALVARLEEIDRATIEYAEGRPVVQYRGALMPLVHLGGGAGSIPDSGNQPVVVFSDRDSVMGLMVDEILDIVEDSLSLDRTGNVASGVMGTAVIAGKATEVLDVGYYLSQAFDDWFGTERSRNGKRRGRKVLLVDDSAFFRNLLSPLLKTAGYEVTSAESAQAALEFCESGRDFDVIISDIEMPKMDGYAFAEAVRKSGRWQDVPMVALSAKVSSSDLDRGRVAGFNDYIPKLDRDGLLDALSQTLSLRQSAA